MIGGRDFADAHIAGAVSRAQHRSLLMNPARSPSSWTQPMILAMLYRPSASSLAWNSALVTPVCWAPMSCTSSPKIPANFAR
jgi:hypothetical protein